MLIESQSGSSIASAFDSLGRRLTESSPRGTMSYQYDAAGRRIRLTWPDSFYVTQDFLVTNEVSAIRENGAASGVGVRNRWAMSLVT